MKFLSSSSSSASSTITSTSFDAINAHNSKNATAGCITGVFRRLLRRNSLPTYPYDHLREAEPDSVDFDKLQCVNSEDKVESSAAPSIVARLMGLESLPRIHVENPQKIPNSISRSRSMNSVDSLKELHSIQGSHRRVMSFREIPTFLELEDENFFILSFENGDGNTKLGLKGRKSEMGSVQRKRGNTDNCKANNKRRESVYEQNKVNQYTRNVSVETLAKATNPAKGSQRVGYDGELKDSSNILRSAKTAYQNSLPAIEVVKLAKPSMHKPESERRMTTKKTKDDCLPVKNIETECEPENSSPNSVLDITDFPCDPEVSSSEVHSRLTNSKPRRTLTEELENYRKLNQYECKTLMIKSYKSTGAEGKCVQLRKNNLDSHRYIEVWFDASRLAETETSQSNWIQDIQKMEDYREISGELGLEILDQLLGELVD